MISEIENPELQEAITAAADALYMSNSDETIRQQCEARREQLIHEQYMEKQMKKLERLEKLEKEFEKLKLLEKEKDEVISKQTEIIAELQATIDKMKK